jgi:hypothetical protein
VTGARGATSAINIFLAGVMTVLWAAGARGEPRVNWVHSADRTLVEVSNIDEAGFAAAGEWTADQWRALLTVSVQQTPEVQMLGSWEVDLAKKVVRFTPKFPLTPGVTYCATFDESQWTKEQAVRSLVGSVFRVPQPRRSPPTVVANVFPSGAEVPENLLKFYLHFSSPMSRGRVYQHIHLLDESGGKIELPFLELDEELWDPEMKRLTLFIDPGRIKREVQPLEEIGPSLQQGKRFTLVIDDALPDAAGKPLAKKFEHSFRVGPPNRKAIVPGDWKLAEPSAGNSDPLSVAFAEPMDHALALRLLQVVREDGSPVEGIAELADSERNWKFKPSHPWKPGAYKLVVPPILEDLAGNNVGKAFEVELVERGEPREIGKSVKLPFTVK